MANRKQSKYGRVDGNQKEMVEALRNLGYSVLILSNVGKGCPDLLVGRNRLNLLVELKDPAQPPSKRRLTEDEVKFFQSWQGLVLKAETIEEIELTFRLWEEK